jgi:polyisoprenoid-binding protein YceI
MIVAPIGDLPSAVAADSYKVDPVHSSMAFRAKHMGVAYFYGRFNQLSGTFTIDEKNPAASSFEVQIKAESIDTNNPMRDQHLKSPDFFDAKQFPLITFKSRQVKAADEMTYEVTGDLTLHGVTRPITVKLERVGSGKGPRGGYITGFDTTFTIKRSDFDMKFMLEGIGDEVRIMMGLEGTRP